MADPRVLRAEVPDASGERRALRLSHTDVEFTVVLPEDPSIAALVLYEPEWTGHDWRLIPLFSHAAVKAWWLAFALTGAMTTAVGGEPVTVIRSHGSAANRVDVVILGDGYTAAELGRYAQDVETLVQGLFADDPLREYQRYFNVYRVDVVSAESGADHPSRGVFRDTALDAAYDCAGIARLICVSGGKVADVLSRSVEPEGRDVVIVVVNDTEYGGSGGAVAVASVNPAAVELMLHELGHSFGLLADEYPGPPPPACNTTVEPPEPNVTMQTQRGRLKWTRWVDAATPVPTLDTVPGQPGLYDGAKYCDTGVYRPTFDSKMRSLGAAWDQINSEQLIKRIYNFTGPIDGVDPPGAAETVGTTEQRTFSVLTPAPLTHPLQVAWSVDGQPAGTGTQLVVDGAALAPGLHTVAVRVDDPTAMVRNDPAGLLHETFTWSVTVTGTPLPVPLAAAMLPASRSVMVGVPATAFVSVINAGPVTARRVGITLASAVPAGFAFQATDPATNAVTGTPNGAVDIAPGQRQTFIVALTPTAEFPPTDVAFGFGGDNTLPVAPLPGVNTLLDLRVGDSGRRRGDAGGDTRQRRHREHSACDRHWRLRGGDGERRGLGAVRRVGGYRGPPASHRRCPVPHRSGNWRVHVPARPDRDGGNRQW